MIARVERAQGAHLQERPDRRGRRHREQEAEDEAVEPGGEGRRQVGADHVQRAVREIDQVHDAEDQRQPGGHQEQHDAELEPVQPLDEDQAPFHRLPSFRASLAGHMAHCST